jgi:hypothetical protein
MKIIPALMLALLTGAASAQQRTFYDARGNVVGRSATDSEGSTIRDARGSTVSRESTRGNVTTIYDAGGRTIGRVSNGNAGKGKN